MHATVCVEMRGELRSRSLSSTFMPAMRTELGLYGLHSTSHAGRLSHRLRGVTLLAATVLFPKCGTVDVKVS